MVDWIIIKQKLIEILQLYLNTSPTQLRGDADLRDYGFDSVDALEFFAEVEREFGVRLDEGADINELNTLDAIALWVAREVSKKDQAG